MAADTAASAFHTRRANAGDDDSVQKNQDYQLDGSGSTDGNHDLLEFLWSQTFGTSVTLDNPEAEEPIFKAPGTTGDLIFKLEVTDGTQEQGEYKPDNSKSEPDTVTITVTN